MVDVDEDDDNPDGSDDVDLYDVLMLMRIRIGMKRLMMLKGSSTNIFCYP